MSSAPAFRNPDPWDSTVPPWPPFNPDWQLCRALLQDFVMRQGEAEPEGEEAKQALYHARYRLRQPKRSKIADEKACWNALCQIRKCMEAMRGDCCFIDPELEALWLRLKSLTREEAINRILSDLQEL